MKTSVPTVVPIKKMQEKLARLLELATDETKYTGDLVHLEDAVSLARRVHEEEFKPAAHRGRLDWGFVGELGAALDRVEAYLEKARARLDAKKK